MGRQSLLLAFVFASFIGAGLFLAPGTDIRAQQPPRDATSKTTPDKTTPGEAAPGKTTPSKAAAGKVAGYVKSETCAGCHAEAAEAWSKSHHSWALRQPTDANVLGNFDDAVFEHKGVKTRFFKRDGKHFVETDGPDGKPAQYKILYTIGVTPLQQYLVELPGGHLQALDIAWDTKQKRWYHLYPEQDVGAGNGLHWTGPYKNWSARCAECHQTNFAKNYAPKAHTYASTWSELTVTCQSCHGPGEAHVAWAGTPAEFKPAQWQGVGPKGLTVNFAADKPATEIGVCAPCHSRRSPFGSKSPPPGAEITDHYRVSLLRDDLYHADGQIKDEVYVYGSFLQSKMYARGVRCTNCHEPHTGELIAEGNAVCTQCHSPAGREGFPTLPKRDYDSSAHHHHKTGTEAAACVSCHMPSKNYMVVDPRRDHSFRVPRPDLSVRIATPNACATCHADKPAQWAADAVAKWYPDGRWKQPHFGESFHAHRTKRSRQTANALANLAVDTKQPAIIRASAAAELSRGMRPDLITKILPLLEDKEPMVRAAATQALQSAPQAVRARALLPLLDDPSRLVRLAATQATLDLRLRAGKEADATIGKARREFFKSLEARSDFPEAQMQIAGLALTQRNLGAAEAAFKEAVRQDPQRVDAWLMRGRIAGAARQPQRAAEILNEGLAANPKSPHLHRALGTVYVQLRRPADAVTQLSAARSLAPSMPGIATDLARAQVAANQVQGAIATLTGIVGTSQETPQGLDMLAAMLARSGEFNRGAEIARRMVQRYPRYRPSRQTRALLGFRQ